MESWWHVHNLGEWLRTSVAQRCGQRKGCQAGDEVDTAFDSERIWAKDDPQIQNDGMLLREAMHDHNLTR